MTPFSPALCSMCGWVGIDQTKEDARTILYECPRCGHRWRVPRPIEVKVRQATLEDLP